MVIHQENRRPIEKIIKKKKFLEVKLSHWKSKKEILHNKFSQNKRSL
jgi:hypothetical protein